MDRDGDPGESFVILALRTLGFGALAGPAIFALLHVGAMAVFTDIRASDMSDVREIGLGVLVVFWFSAVPALILALGLLLVRYLRGPLSRLGMVAGLGLAAGVVLAAMLWGPFFRVGIPVFGSLILLTIVILITLHDRLGLSGLSRPRRFDRRSGTA